MSDKPQPSAGGIALVTGGGRGIGRAIAQALGRCGVRVIVNFRADEGAAAEVVKGIRDDGGEAWPVQADVATKAGVEALFAQVRQLSGDHLDFLINNAGGPAERHPVATMPEEVWDDCMATNLKSAFLCTQAAHDLLPDGSGRIVNVTSISARSGGGPGMSHYAAAKAGMSNFTRACAKELAPRRITVNGIAPGVIYTDLHKHGTPQQELDELETRIPLGRLGQVDDVAGIAVFLCSAGAAYITGEIIEVNGGLLMS